jgi:hypothetical protein
MKRGPDCKGMIYGLKLQFLDGGNCRSSSVGSHIVMEKEDPFGQKSAMTANCRLQFPFQHGVVPYTVDCLSFLLIVLKNWSSCLPEQCQHKFSGRGCRLERFLGRRWFVAIPRIVFGFWFIIMNSDFIPRENARKKLLTLGMVTCQESSASRHTLQLVFISQLPQHHLEHSDIWEPHRWCHAQHSGNSVHRNPLILTNNYVHASNVGITDGCAQAT